MLKGLVVRKNSRGAHGKKSVDLSKEKSINPLFLKDRNSQESASNWNSFCLYLVFFIIIINCVLNSRAHKL